MLKRLKKRHSYDYIFFLIGFLILSIGGYFYFISTMFNQTLKSAILSIKTILVEQQLFESVTNTVRTISQVSIIQLITLISLAIVLLISTWVLLRLYLTEKEDALVDHLTQVRNRRGIMMALKREISRSNRYNENLTVGLLDIDFFKKYNDTNGHGEGDVALNKVAQIAKKAIRNSDIIGRYGGEEFLLIFPEINNKEAKIICNRIRRDIEKARFKGAINMPNKKVTVSIGLSSDRKAYVKKELLLSSDENLYRAKDAGRNQVI
ncbi:GGDEF domain-containing protein [archaeon]|nr:GGDEF domain-containing protein [archaeon]